MNKKSFLKAGFFLFAFLFMLCVESHAAEDNIGWVTALKGRAEVLHPRDKSKTVLESGSPVYLGSEISTGKDSSVTIEFDDDSLLAIGPESRVKITEWLYSSSQKKNRLTFKIFTGRARGILNGIFGSNSAMSFETPTSVAGIKGSDMMVWIEGDETCVVVSEGAGFMRSVDKLFLGEVKIESGYMASAKKGERIKAAFVATEKARAFVSEFHVKRNKELIQKLRHARQEKRKELLKKRDGERKERLREKMRQKKDLREGRNIRQ
ncbi:MAG: FecR domain-containing protein [Deltaproteobacteria bacterium]